MLSKTTLVAIIGFVALTSGAPATKRQSIPCNAPGELVCVGSDRFELCPSSGVVTSSRPVAPGTACKDGKIVGVGIYSGEQSQPVALPAPSTAPALPAPSTAPALPAPSTAPAVSSPPTATAAPSPPTATPATNPVSIPCKVVGELVCVGSDRFEECPSSLVVTSSRPVAPGTACMNGKIVGVGIYSGQQNETAAH